MKLATAMALDRAIRDALLDLDDVLEIGGLPDDLLMRVMDGDLSLDEAHAVLETRAREPFVPARAAGGSR